MMGWRGGGLRLTFERLKGRGEGATKTEQVRTREEGGSKYRALSDNTVSKCPLL